jgi:hypothetical protein
MTSGRASMLPIVKSIVRAVAPNPLQRAIASAHRDWRNWTLRRWSQGRRIRRKSVRFITYNGERVPLFFHRFNCGYKSARTTERSVELALAFRWLQLISGPVIEVGAVTPYYTDKRTELTKIDRVIDPTDPHPAITDRWSLFEYDFCGKNVLSISTLEHVGMGDYGLPEEDCIAACEKLVRDSASCFVTVPLGYNPKLDAHLYSADWPMTTLTVVYRSSTLNDWKTTRDRSLIGKILYGPAWANGIVIIERLVP